MITLAQIGCGYWGPNLLRNFSALPGARVKYVVETSEARRRYVEMHYPQINVIASTNAMYDDPEVTAVVVATPAQTHFPLALQALHAGRHVFVEKPLAMSVAEVDTLAHSYVSTRPPRSRVLEQRKGQDGGSGRLFP